LLKDKIPSLSQSDSDSNSNFFDLELIRKIKESKCFLSNDYDKEMDNYKKQSNKYSTFCLPDGQKVKVNEEMIKCPEAMFQPT